MSETPSYPSAAQLAQNEARIKTAIRDALQAANLRIKAVELAAQFNTGDPVKLAEQLYEFIKKDVP